MSNSRKIALPTPPEVQVFFKSLTGAVGEFCQVAVLSYMLDMVNRMYSRVDQDSNSSLAESMINDLTDGGVIDESPEGLPDVVYNIVLCEGTSAIYALGEMVRRYRIDSGIEFEKLHLDMDREYIFAEID